MQEGSKSKTIVYVMLAAFLRDAVTIGRNPMDIFIDEGWVLLRSKVFRDMLDELGRRARKRDVAVVLTTHLPSDFLQHGTSLNLATNSFIGRMEKSQAFEYLGALGILLKRLMKQPRSLAILALITLLLSRQDLALCHFLFVYLFHLRG